MAVRIVSPQSAVITKGTTVTLTWSPEYPQSAYEIMYRKKGDVTWSTFGRKESTDISTTLNLSKFTDFEEYHYRVVCYSYSKASGNVIYDGNDTSAAYSIIVVPAQKVATFKAKYGSGMIEVPLYEDATIKDAVSVKFADGKIGRAPIRETASTEALGTNIKGFVNGKKGKFLTDKPVFTPSNEAEKTYMRVDTASPTHYQYYDIGYTRVGPVGTGSYSTGYTMYYDGADANYRYGYYSYIVGHDVSSYSYKYNKTYYVGKYASTYTYKYGTYYLGYTTTGYTSGWYTYRDWSYGYRAMTFLGEGGYARVYEVDHMGQSLWYYRYRTASRIFYRGFNSVYYFNDGYEYIRTAAYITAGWMNMNTGAFEPSAGYATDYTAIMGDLHEKMYYNRIYGMYYGYYKYSYASAYLSYYAYYRYAYESGYSAYYGYMRYSYLSSYTKLYGYYRYTVPLYEYYYNRYQIGPKTDAYYTYSRYVVYK